jgi:RNA polymerase sigma factor (sigma-70 family)
VTDSTEVSATLSYYFLFGFGIWRIFTHDMGVTDSQKLLEEYVRNGSEAAFRELVQRYLDLVYSTSIRLVAGDTHLAEDIVQTVFFDLARLARTFSPRVLLGGWLHRHTCFVAAKTLRSERRRQLREREAVEMNALHSEPQANLAQVAPILDEAINQLGEKDRTAILLRFFESRDFREVGKALGGNEDAARMRVNRALEKLELLLRRQGVSLPAAALGTALAGEAVAAGPVGLAGTAAGSALAGAAAAGGMTSTFSILSYATKLQLCLTAALVLVVLAASLLVRHRLLDRLRAENQALRRKVSLQADLLAKSQAENTRLTTLFAQANRQRGSRDARSELLKLRGEAGVLRRQIADDIKTVNIFDIGDNPEGADGQSPEVKGKFALGQMLMNAIVNFSGNNKSQFPTNLEQVAPFIPEDKFWQTGLPSFEPDIFEIVHSGTIATPLNPWYTIALREKEPWQGEDGKWRRVYIFFGGRGEVHKSADGNFETWEAQHTAASSVYHPLPWDSTTHADHE